VLKSVFAISFFIAISRVLGFIRDIMIATYLGAGYFSDIFFAAFKLPNFFRRVFAEGAFNAAFVPMFSKKLDNKKSAIAFAQNIFSILLYILLIVILFLQAIMPWFIEIIFPGFVADNNKISLLVTLSRITIFYLLFIAITSLFCAILNSYNKFSATSSVSIILNATLIFAIIFLSPFLPNFAYALSWGVFIAGILQILWISFFLIRKRIFIYPKLPKLDAETKKFFKKFFSGIIGANVMQINLLIDSIIASFYAGAISYIYYADRINQLPLAMIGIAINIALLPKLSKAIKNNKKEAVSLQNFSIEIAMILAIPAASALFILAPMIMEVLFMRGEFGIEQVKITAQCLQLYTLALPAYIIAKVLEPSFFANEDTKTPMKIAIICVIFNIICNLILMNFFAFKGVIVASILASYLNVFLMIRMLKKNGYFLLKIETTRKIIKIIIPNLMMILAIIFLQKFLEEKNTSLLLQLITLITVGLAIYVATSRIFGIISKSTFAKIKSI
jgi:putative peptidoglycan lipid II flippase